MCCCVSGWVVPEILKEYTAPILKGQVDKEILLGPIDSTSDAVTYQKTGILDTDYHGKVQF